jgi:hypothetical protein
VPFYTMDRIGLSQACRRPIEMTPVCEIEMTLPEDFSGVFGVFCARGFGEFLSYGSDGLLPLPDGEYRSPWCNKFR